MSQRSVEFVIGRLLTDEDFLRLFETSRESALLEVTEAGHPLTPVEHRALTELDLRACKRFTECLDPRLQKISLKRSGS